MHKISDSTSVLLSGQSADIVTPYTPTRYVAAARFRLFSIFVGIDAVAATKTVTIQPKQATDASGTGSKNLGTAIVVTAPGGGWTNKELAVDFDINALDDANGFDFIGFTISSNNTSATPARAVLVGADSRFRPS